MMFGRFKAWMDGRKTHISAVCTALAVVWLYKHGMASEKDVTEAVGAALVFMFLRHGVNKAVANNQGAVTSVVRDLQSQFGGLVSETGTRLPTGNGGGQPAQPTQPQTQPPAAPPQPPTLPPATPSAGKQWP